MFQTVKKKFILFIPPSGDYSYIFKGFRPRRSRKPLGASVDPDRDLIAKAAMRLPAGEDVVDGATCLSEHA